MPAQTPSPVSRAAGPLGPLLALLAFGIYATHDVIVKVLGTTYSALQITFFVGLFGFPLVVLMLLRDPVPGTMRAVHPWLALTRAMAIVASGTLGFYAFTVLPLAQVYTMLFTAPLIVTLLSVPVLGEKVGVHRGLAIVAGMIGVLVVLRPGYAPVSLGHAAALLAAVNVAVSAVIARKVGRVERSAVLMVLPMLVMVVVLGAMLPFVYVPVALPDLGLMAIVAAMSFAAGLLLLIAYRKAEASIVAPMQYSQILWAGFYGAVFFDESPDAWTMAGSALIIASGLYIVFRESRRDVSATQPVLAIRARIGAVPAGKIVENGQSDRAD
ncbi:MAG: DMT family transporter [Paracoccaceae bacterium]